MKEKVIRKIMKWFQSSIYAEVWFKCCNDRYMGGTYIKKYGFSFTCGGCGRKYQGTKYFPTLEHQAFVEKHWKKWQI